MSFRFCVKRNEAFCNELLCFEITGLLERRTQKLSLITPNSQLFSGTIAYKYIAHHLAQTFGFGIFSCGSNNVCQMNISSSDLSRGLSCHNLCHEINSSHSTLGLLFLPRPRLSSVIFSNSVSKR